MSVAQGLENGTPEAAASRTLPVTPSDSTSALAPSVDDESDGENSIVAATINRGPIRK